MSLSRFFLSNIEYSYPTITPESVLGVHMYAVRDLVSADCSDDVIWMPSEFDKMATDVFSHLNQAGISPTENIVFADDWRDVDLGKYPGFDVHPFIMNDAMRAFTGEQDWHHGVMEFERKTRFARFCSEHDLPIPRTYMPEDVDCLTDEDFARGLFGKLAYTASGIGMKRLYSRAGFEQWRRDHPAANRFVLQEPFPKVAEFGVQLDLTDEPEVVAIAGQHIGDGNAHIGNFVPVHLPINVERVIEQSLVFGRAMKAAGIRHRCGLDGMSDASDNYVFGEANARRTGNSFAIDAAQAMGVQTWSYKNLLTMARSVDDLKLGGNSSLFYRPGQETGLVVLNAGPVGFGKLSVMFVGAPKTWAKQEAECRAWLQCDQAEAEAAAMAKAA